MHYFSQEINFISKFKILNWDVWKKIIFFNNCLFFFSFLNKIWLLIKLRNADAVKVTLLDKLTIEFGLQRALVILGQRGDGRNLAKLGV